MILTGTPDGTAWTQQPVSGTLTESLTGVIYANEQFVAVGNNQVMSSTDGINWNALPTEPAGITGPTVDLFNTTYGNNLFVTVGTYNTSTLDSGDRVPGFYRDLARRQQLVDPSLHLELPLGGHVRRRSVRHRRPGGLDPDVERWLDLGHAVGLAIGRERDPLPHQRHLRREPVRGGGQLRRNQSQHRLPPHLSRCRQLEVAADERRQPLRPRLWCRGWCWHLRRSRRGIGCLRGALGRRTGSASTAGATSHRNESSRVGERPVPLPPCLGRAPRPRVRSGPRDAWQADGTRACPKDHRDRGQDGTSPSDSSFGPAATGRFPGGAGDSTAAGEGGREETAAGSDSSASRAGRKKSSSPLRHEPSRPKKSSRPFRLLDAGRTEAGRRGRGRRSQAEGQDGGATGGGSGGALAGVPGGVGARAQDSRSPARAMSRPTFTTLHPSIPLSLAE